MIGFELIGENARGKSVAFAAELDLGQRALLPRAVADRNPLRTVAHRRHMSRSRSVTPLAIDVRPHRRGIEHVVALRRRSARMAIETLANGFGAQRLTKPRSPAPPDRFAWCNYDFMLSSHIRKSMFDSRRIDRGAEERDEGDSVSPRSDRVIELNHAFFPLLLALDFEIIAAQPISPRDVGVAGILDRPIDEKPRQGRSTPSHQRLRVF